MDDSVTTVLTLTADHALDPENPSLIIRCSHGRTELYVHTGKIVESVYGEVGISPVRYRFDDGKPISERWNESRGSEAVFAPNAVQLAKRIAQAKRWRIEYQPFRGAAAVASFRPAKLNDVLPKIETACHWPTPQEESVARARALPRSRDYYAERYPPIRAGIEIVADREDRRYMTPDCATARLIPPESRVYFKSEQEAQTKGYTRLMHGC